MPEPVVTFGVPAYRGKDFLGKTLDSIRSQTYPHLEVLVSVDGGDPGSTVACTPYLADPRFRMVVQAERLGWAGNINWLIAHRTGDYFIYQQQDDWISPTYVEDLLATATKFPDAALCYAEMDVSGLVTAQVKHLPVLGAAVTRALTHLERLDTSMFRGLIRGSALAQSGGLPLSEFENFSAEHPFMARLALAGEFRFASRPTYFKRIHEAGTHIHWYSWSEERKRAAWISLAAWMLEAIVPAGASEPERWHLLWSVLDRFTAPRTGTRWMFCAIDEENPAEGTILVAAILERARTHTALDLPALLGRRWEELCGLAREPFARRRAAARTP